jgi:hypothetical protein
MRIYNKQEIEKVKEESILPMNPEVSQTIYTLCNQLTYLLEFIEKTKLNTVEIQLLRGLLVDCEMKAKEDNTSEEWLSFIKRTSEHIEVIDEANDNL